MNIFLAHTVSPYCSVFMRYDESAFLLVNFLNNFISKDVLISKVNGCRSVVDDSSIEWLLLRLTMNAFKYLSIYAYTSCYCSFFCGCKNSVY